MSLETCRTRKRGNCECIATWGSPTPLSPHIRLNTSPVASLKSLSLSVAVLERIYCWYVTLCCDLELWPRDLDLWPLPLNLQCISSVTWWNSAKFERNRTIRGGVIAIWNLTLWPWTRITCSAMLWDSLHKVQTQSSYPFMKCDDSSR